MSNRRLAAIMFTDIVGYTAMMQEDEQDALKRVKRHRLVLEQCTAGCHGEVLQYYGDGSLSVFSSAIDAVTCALEIQQTLQSHPSVPLRIGLHIGDIVVESGNIYGDGVNISSRIESIGVSGSVLFSREVRNKIRNRPEFQTQSLGSFHFKNVSEPVEVFALSNAGLSIPEKDQIKGKLSQPVIPDRSIAVLPFENMSSDPEQEYFSDGITEEILNVLAQLPDLKVAGRTSSFSFKGKHVDLREVGQKLNVRTVLEGSVRKAGNKVRITAQLINAEDGYHLWSERYDRELTDIFAIQDEISLAIADKLKVTLLKGKEKSLVKPATSNLDAYQLYLRGRHYLDRRFEEIEQAVTCFQKALELDPQFAPAHSGLGYSYFYQAVFNFKSPLTGLPQAREAARKALRIDPDLAEAHLILGIVALYLDWDWEAARQHDQRGIDLSPNSFDGYRVKAYFHTVIREMDQAISLAKKAVELDPLNVNAQISLAEIYYRDRNIEQAMEVLAALLETHPKLSAAHYQMGLCHLYQNNHTAALQSMERAVLLFGEESWVAVGYLVVLARMGREEEVRKKLTSYEQNRKKDWLPAVFVGIIHIALGDLERGISWVEKGAESNDFFAVLMNIDPFYDPVRKHPRFQKLLRRMGFPP